MLRIGPYNSVYQSHLKSFSDIGYSKTESAILAQTLVARPVPTILKQKSADFVAAIPNARAALKSKAQYSVSEAMIPALDFVQYERTLPLEIEESYLLAAITEKIFVVPEVAETAHVMALPKQEFKPVISVGDAIVRLAMVERKLRQFEHRFFETKLTLNYLFDSVQGKSTTLQSVLISKANYTKAEAHSMADRNNWGPVTDDNETHFRYRQHSPDSCEDGSYRTIDLKDGVQGVVCKLKRGVAEQVNEDYSNVGGHSVTLDHNRAASGNLGGVEQQIKKHGVFRRHLQAKGFTKVHEGSAASGEKHTKSLGNGLHHANVVLAGGMAHTFVVGPAFGNIKVGSATTVPDMDDDIGDAEDAAESAEMAIPAMV